MSILDTMTAVKFPGNFVMFTARSGSSPMRSSVLSKLIPEQYKDVTTCDDEAFFLNIKGIPREDIRNLGAYDELFFIPCIEMPSMQLKWAIQRNVFATKTAWIVESFDEAIRVLKTSIEETVDKRKNV